MPPCDSKLTLRSARSQDTDFFPMGSELGDWGEILPDIELKDCTAKEFREFKRKSLQNFVEERLKVEPKTFRSAAMVDAVKQFDLYCNQPNKVSKVMAGKNHVGWLWWMISGGRFYSMHVIIESPFRRQGYGTAIVKEIESIAKSMGYTQVWGQIFADNTASIVVHTKAGYKVTNYILMKEI